MNSNLKWNEVYQLIAEGAKANALLDALKEVLLSGELYDRDKVKLACALLGISKEGESE